MTEPAHETEPQLSPVGRASKRFAEIMGPTFAKREPGSPPPELNLSDLADVMNAAEAIVKDQTASPEHQRLAKSLADRAFNIILTEALKLLTTTSSTPPPETPASG